MAKSKVCSKFKELLVSRKFLLLAANLLTLVANEVFSLGIDGEMMSKIVLASSAWIVAQGIVDAK